ncbi:MAG: hypothetical protein AB7G87_06200 [Clostridia bacterium]
MNRIGVITTSDNIKYKYIPDCIYQRMPRKIINAICLTFKKIRYESINIPGMDVSITAVRLPVTAQQLDTLGQRSLEYFCNTAIDYFEKEGIESIFICESLQLYRRVLGKAYQRIQKYIYRGKKLFISLCVEISKKICKILELNPIEMRIRIIESSYSWKSKLFISMLSPHAKYISLVTHNIKDAQADMDKIYEETGLTVHVSDRPVKSSELELVYVLDDASQYFTKEFLGAHTILFFLSPEGSSSIDTNNIIMDGIDIRMPSRLNEITKTLNLTNTEAFIEAILSLELVNTFSDKDYNYYDEMKKSFERLGCKINALKSRDTIVNIKWLERITRSMKDC